jgi:hypothetical protein
MMKTTPSDAFPTGPIQFEEANSSNLRAAAFQVGLCESAKVFLMVI